MEVLVARVPEEVFRTLKTHAAEEGQSVDAIVEGLIRQYLAKLELLERRKSWCLEATKLMLGST